MEETENNSKPSPDKFRIYRIENGQRARVGDTYDFDSCDGDIESVVEKIAENYNGGKYSVDYFIKNKYHSRSHDFYFAPKQDSKKNESSGQGESNKIYELLLQQAQTSSQNMQQLMMGFNTQLVELLKTNKAQSNGGIDAGLLGLLLKQRADPISQMRELNALKEELSANQSPSDSDGGSMTELLKLAGNLFANQAPPSPQPARRLPAPQATPKPMPAANAAPPPPATPKPMPAANPMPQPPATPSVSSELAEAEESMKTLGLMLARFEKNGVDPNSAAFSLQNILSYQELETFLALEPMLEVMAQQMQINSDYLSKIFMEFKNDNQANISE